MAAGPAPGFKRRPDYSILIDPYDHAVTVTVGGNIIAESTQALILREQGHAPVLYLPREDVNMTAMRRTTRTTHCPYKGDASYWSLDSDQGAEEYLVWSYESPFHEAAAITGRLAFDAKRVALLET